MAEEETERKLVQSLRKTQQQFNIIKIRLDTDKLMGQIEAFLRGYRVVAKPDSNSPQGYSYENEKFSEPKATDQGISSILNWLTAKINSQTVQGNYPVDKTGYSWSYIKDIKDLRIDFSKYILINRIDWEISVKEVEGVIDFVMHITKPFLSRLIGNLERTSYIDTLQARESVVHGEPDKKRGFFGLGGK